MKKLGVIIIFLLVMYYIMRWLNGLPDPPAILAFLEIFIFAPLDMIVLMVVIAILDNREEAREKKKKSDVKVNNSGNTIVHYHINNLYVGGNKQPKKEYLDADYTIIDDSIQNYPKLSMK